MEFWRWRVLRKIFVQGLLRVVDEFISTKALDKLLILARRTRNDTSRAFGFGNLDGKRADGRASAIDENGLTSLESCATEESLPRCLCS